MIFWMVATSVQEKMSDDLVVLKRDSVINESSLHE